MISSPVGRARMVRLHRTIAIGPCEETASTSVRQN
jgi:hypothetical protein